MFTLFRYLLELNWKKERVLPCLQKTILVPFRDSFQNFAQFNNIRFRIPMVLVTVHPLVKELPFQNNWVVSFRGTIC